HTPALLRDDSSVTPLNATGLPLGLFSHVTHDACTVALEQGSALVLVSRGVTEAKHRGKEYGIERVGAVLRDSAAAGAEQLCGEILDDVERFMGKRPADNDVTALALTRRAAAGAATAG